MFRVSVLHRKLQKLERGAWSFSTKLWPLKEKQIFLKRLKRCISSGKLGGWVGATIQIDVTTNSGNDGIKVCCWAANAVHIWCVLYILSHRRTSKGLVWVDVRDSIVIEC